MSISLIIPTRDRARYLSQCLASLDQYGYLQMDDVQVIVVDNDSRGRDTSMLCASYPNITYLVEWKHGRAAAVNTGIKHAKGEYIAFTDDDVIARDSSWLYHLRSNFENRYDVGYVSGNVIAYQLETQAQQMWEVKGGLSKGDQHKRFGPDFFARRRLVGVPVRLIAAGANSMIPKSVLEEVGYHDEMFGPGSLVGHGESLDICYRVLKHGYTAIYDPEAIVFHCHPRSLSSLRKKMFKYGIGDTAIHTKFFFEYWDVRSLFEVLWGRPFLLLARLAHSLIGTYPMTPDMLIAGYVGALLGPWIYAYARILSRIR